MSLLHLHARFWRKTRDVTALALVVVVMGVAIGLVCAGFRLTLEYGEWLRLRMLAEAGNNVLFDLLIVLGIAGLAAAAAGLVHRLAPSATGSGIPHIEAVLQSKALPSNERLIPIKFAGGAMAISGGLALGREGPSVQMGGTIGHLMGKWLRLDWAKRRALMAGGAGAGLATAFNAPVAGAVFVMEELVGCYEPHMAIVALGASVAAITSSRWVLGHAPEFIVPVLPPGGLDAQALFLLLGVIAGFLSVGYNRTMLGTLSLSDTVKWPVELKAALIGAMIGVLALVTPELLGGGIRLTQQALDGDFLLAVIPFVFVFRLLLGALSYAAATPGGLFAPMLVLGSTAGLAFGQVTHMLLPGFGVPPEAFALVGICAFFAGVTRAPVTGIVLVSEMTDSATMLLPMLVGSFGAMIVTEAMGEKPIYVSLRARAAHDKR